MIIRRIAKNTDEGAEQFSFRVSLGSSDLKKWLRESYESRCYTGSDGKLHRSVNWLPQYDTKSFILSIFDSGLSWLPSYKREPVISWAYRLAVSKGYIVEGVNETAYIDYDKISVKPGPQPKEN